jgi:hypothetical protein
VTAFLSQRGGSCGGDDQCLAELARATGAARGVFVTLAPYTPRVIVSAKIVTVTGAVRTTTREFPKSGGLPRAVRNALKRFLSELDVDLTAPIVEPLVAPAPPDGPTPVARPPVTAPPLVESPPAVASPPPSPTPYYPPNRMSTWRIASYACMGLGAAAIIGAGAIFEGSGNDRIVLTSLLNGQSYIPEGNPQAAQLQRTLKQDGAIATGLVVTAVVAGAAGVTLYSVAPARAPTVAVAPSSHGAQLVLNGSF